MTISLPRSDTSKQLFRCSQNQTWTPSNTM